MLLSLTIYSCSDNEIEQLIEEEGNGYVVVVTPLDEYPEGAEMDSESKLYFSSKVLTVDSVHLSEDQVTIVLEEGIQRFTIKLNGNLSLMFKIQIYDSTGEPIITNLITSETKYEYSFRE